MGVNVRLGRGERLVVLHKFLWMTERMHMFGFGEIMIRYLCVTLLFLQTSVSRSAQYVGRSTEDKPVSVLIINSFLRV